MFPEDFFGTPNQYKTIQTQINANREHPKIINPLLFKNKPNQPPFISEIKEEKCEESIMEISKNKNTLKIIIPHNVSTEEISTSGGSYNTPVTPNMPIIVKTEPNSYKNNKKDNYLKDKILSNNNNVCSSLNKNNNNNQNNTINEDIDLCYPMAFTFNLKEKKNQTIKNNNRHGGYKYNNSLDRNKKGLKDIKKRDLSAQNKKSEKIKKDNKSERNNSNSNRNIIKKEDNIKKNNKHLNISYRKCFSYENNNNKNNNINNDNKNENEYKRNFIRNNSKRDNKKIIKNTSFDRRSKSAKKSKETINIMTVKSNRNLLKKNNKEDKKDLYNRNNLQNLKVQYEKKKKEIVHSKVEKEINHIFQKLPDNYEKYPEINNKLELFMKNIDDIKYVLNKKRQKI